MAWFSKQDKERAEICRFLNQEYLSVGYFNYALHLFKSRYGETVCERLVADERFIAIRNGLESAIN